MSTIFFKFFLSVLHKLFKGLLAQVVLHPAGVPGGHLRVNTETHEKLGEQPVPVIHPPGDGKPRLGQDQAAVLVHLHISALMATLTLALVKASSLATSTERT